MICVRCCQPKPRSAFSSVEISKKRSEVKICEECGLKNPYFERRYAIVLMFGHRSSAQLTGGLVSLPQEALQMIIEFSEPGDKFTVVHQQSFECRLCFSQQWSLLTNDVERHVRCSKQHQLRSAKLRRGELLHFTAGLADDGEEIEARLRVLGVRGDVCSRQQMEEAESLVSVASASAQGVRLEALRAAGLATD